MVYNRKAISPWSVEREAGIESATVDSNIEVPQYLQPTVDTGFIDEKGFWRGNTSSDKDFIAFGTFEAIANGGTILAPYVNADGTWPLDMTGFEDIQIALKVSRAGDYKIEAVMGPDSNSYSNLSPVNSAALLRGLFVEYSSVSNHMNDAFNDAAEALIADVWNIFMIKAVLSNQKLLQFQITNNSGGSSDIETAFMRLVD